MTTERPRPPLLITGVAGVAGYNAFRHFHPRRTGVVGARRRDNWRLSGPGIVGVDLHDRPSLAKLFDEHPFEAVLNCEGTCALRSCELDPLLAWRVNVLSVQNLCELIVESRRPIRLIHLSIDLVFSGEGEGGHVEIDETDPVTVYGKTMEQTERIVLDACPDACVLRISLPMGTSFNGHAGAIDWIQSRFRQGKPATLYYDEIRTPTYTDCLNRIFHDLLANDLSGLFHAGGPRQLSLYQIAQIVNRVGGYDPACLMGCDRIEAGPIPPRAGDVSMDSSKLQAALGYAPFSPWPLNPGFVPTDRDWHRARDGFQGSPELLAEELYRLPDRAS